MNIYFLIVGLLSFLLSGALFGETASIDFKGPVTTEKFREIFASQLRNDHTDHFDNFEKLIYMPVESMGQPLGPSDSAESFMEVLNSNYRSISPMDLFSKGADTKESLKGSILNRAQARESRREFLLEEYSDDFSDAVSKQPLTIVVVPGVFSEFVDIKAFQEVFDGDSSYRKKVQKTFRLKKVSEWRKNGREDEDEDEFKPDSLYFKFLSVLNVGSRERELAKTEKRPITDFFTVSNIGENVKVILFNSERMSLETLGPFEDRADRYLTRLNAFFKLMGVPDNIAFIGYSRGAIIALDMLAKAKKEDDNSWGDRYSWIKNVKAMTSVGGVNYGADSADPLECEDPTAPGANLNCTMLYLMEKLASDLEYIEESLLKDVGDFFGGFFGNKPILNAFRPVNLGIRARNFKRYTDFMLKLNSAYNKDIELKKQQEGPKKKDNSKGSKGSKDERRLQKLLQKAKGTFSSTPLSFMRAGDSSTSIDMMFQIFFESIELDKFYSEYNKNISKFKLVVHETATAVKQLSTKSRFEWWRKNNLPVDGVRYYSIAGTMADLEPATDGFILGENDTAYDKNLNDYKFLRFTYDQYVKDSTFKLNDSQMSIHKARFWPKLNGLLNPYYKENRMQETFLGVLGVHHWGLTLKYANKMADESFSPFPRMSLFKSIATAVALDIQSEKDQITEEDILE